MAERAPTGDDRDDLVREIAENLREHGAYVADVDPRPNQRLVDLRWASLRAGRRLGLRTRMHVVSGASPREPLVRITVVCVDAFGHVVEASRAAVRAMVHRS